jgi:hypothetical protein
VWMAYTLDLKGDEVYKLYVRNVTWAGGKAVKSQTLGPISNVGGGEIVWANDNTTFFCITQVGFRVLFCRPVLMGTSIMGDHAACNTYVRLVICAVRWSLQVPWFS